MDDLDPFDKWRIRALANARRLRFSPDVVNEAAGVLEAALGKAWLLDASTRLDRGSSFGFRVHPIGNALEAGGDYSILQLLELSSYLRISATVPGVEIVGKGLETHFYSSRFHLAVGARIIQAGGAGVIYEPPASGGLAGDVRFRYGEHVFQAECYRPTIAAKGNYETERQLLTREALELCGSTPPLSIGIYLTRPLNAPGRKHILGTLKRMRRRLLDGPDYVTLEVLDHAAISLGKTVMVGPGEDSVFVLHPEFETLGRQHIFTRIIQTTRDAAFSLQAPNFQGQSGTHLGLWLSKSARETHSGNDVDPGEQLLRLARKVSKKIRQTRAEGVSMRLMFVETPLAAEVRDLSPSTLAEATRELFEKHRNVAAVVLMGRRWDDVSMREKYAFHPLLPLGGSEAAAFVDGLIAGESRFSHPELD